ncbi:Retrovirus-related Pol polyprotein from transposon opus, partial [Mucuna pruriens]
MKTETISAKEDQMKVRAKATVPSGSDIKAKQREGTDSILSRITPVRRSRPNQPKAEVMTTNLVPSSTQDGQPDSKANTEKSPSPPPLIELKPLPKHLKYAYMDKEQQLPIIIAHNLQQEQEDKLLDILKQHTKAIGWKLSDLPVTKLLATGIIYPILDSQWVSLVQVVPKKSRMTVMKNQHDELATRKDHFPLSFIDQVLEKLSGRSHYCFLDGFSGYMQIHIALEDQHKTTFTCPFGTFAYTCIPFVLYNASSTFQRYMTSIFLDLLQECMEVFMDDFMVYADSFEACLENLSKVLKRCVDTNLMLNFEKCHFMVIEEIMLGHLVSNRGIEVDKSKIDIISSLSNPTSVREVRSFLGRASFYKRFIKNFSKLSLPLSKLL